MKTMLCLLIAAATTGLQLKSSAAPVQLENSGEHFRGMADASAGVMLGTNFLAVGNDEDNQIRIYRLDSPGMPVRSVDCSGFLRVFGKNLESDLEGAAWLEDRIFWIGSHGENRNGRSAPNRRRLFATLVTTNTGVPSVQPIDHPYENLLADLALDARYHEFGLERAALLPPKSPGGLNIEGLCATPDGQLMIGFRNPIPGGKALIVTLSNPGAVVRGASGRFGSPILLELDGNGIRDMGHWRGKYYLLAGSFDPQKHFQLYDWAGPGCKPERLSNVEFKHSNPEALVFNEDLNRFLVLSDDGTHKVGGVESKNLPDPTQRKFRALWLALPAQQADNLRRDTLPSVEQGLPHLVLGQKLAAGQ